MYMPKEKPILAQPILEKPIPPKRLKQLRLTAETARRLAYAARLEGMPQTVVVELALREYLTKLNIK